MKKLTKNLKKKEDINKQTLTNLEKKKLFILVDHFLNESQNRGCFCYLITTKFPPLNLNNNDDEYSLQVFLLIINQMSDIAFYTLAVELDENRRPLVNVFLAIQNLIGNNSKIKSNLINNFLLEDFFDTQIVECSTFTDKTKAFKYVLKKVLIEKEKLNSAFVINYNNWSDLGCELRGFLKEKEIKIRIEELKAPKRITFTLLEPDENIKNMSFNNIINLFRLYLEDKNWYINENKLYEGIKDTKLSVKMIKKIEHIDELYEEIKIWMIEKHFYTFYDFNFIELKNKFLKQFTEHFINDPTAVGQKIQLSYNLMEFTDGIYIISTDTFIQYKNYTSSAMRVKAAEVIGTFQEKFVRTVSYYNKTYKNRKKPEMWVKYITERIVDPKQVTNFFIGFAKFFNEELGKNTITTIINGPSNTLKTTLVAQPIINYYSLDHVGIVTRSQTFLVEDSLMRPKFVMLCNELRLDPEKLQEWLELTSWDSVTTPEKKPMIILAVDWARQINNVSVDKRVAIENRTTVFQFQNPISIPNHEYKKLIKVLSKELPDIIIFCNKLAKKPTSRTIVKTV